MKRGFTILRYLGVPVALLIEQYARSAASVRVGLISSYRYMASDSFDYITQGFFLAAKLNGLSVDTPLPVLREPGLVLVATTDAWLAGGSGAVVLWFLASSSGLLAFALLVVGRAVTGRAPGVATNALVLGVMLNPLAEFRYFVLAEHAALALGFTSLVLALSANDEFRGERAGAADSGESMFARSVAAVFVGPFVFLSGLFRLDMAVGFGAVIALYLVAVARGTGSGLVPKKPARSVLISLLMGLAALALARVLWRNAIPHESVPTTFELFGFPPANLVHVATAATIYFVPALVFGFCCWILAMSPNGGGTDGVDHDAVGTEKVRRIGHGSVPLLWVCMGSVSLAWMLVAASYGWRDARFILFSYYGLAVILSSLTLRLDAQVSSPGAIELWRRPSSVVRASLVPLCVVIFVASSAAYGVDSIYAPTGVDVGFGSLSEPRFFGRTAFPVQDRYGIWARCDGRPYCREMVIDDVSEYRTSVLTFLRDHVPPS